MQLIGYLDSPFVRRVAVTMQFLGIGYTHRELSVFRNYDEFRSISPLVKVPTLQLKDYPALAAFSARAEALPEFLACPLSG